MLRPGERSTLAAGSPARRRTPPLAAVLAITSLCAAMAFIDATVVNIAFPSIARSFPTSSVRAISWVLNAYNVVFASFLVAAGRFSDLFGRRRMLLAGVGVFVVGSALCATATSVAELVGFRVLQAIGGAMLVPCAMAVVLDSFPFHRRAHAVAVFSAISALAAGVGPALGGALISLSSWRLVFLVNLPVGVIAMVLVRVVIVESRAPGRRRLPDLGGALALAATVGALVLAIVKGQDWGWLGARVLGAFAVSAVLAVVFVWRSSRHRTPLLDPAVIRVRAVAVSDAMTVIAAAGFYGYTLVNVLFLTGVWHYSILDAGLGITPGPFVAIAVAGPASRLCERIGPRLVLLLGGIVWAAGVLWFVVRTGSHPDFAGRWLPGMLLVGIGAGAFFPNISSVAVSQASDANFATATSLNAVARQLGAALGVAAVVAIIGSSSPATAVSAFHHAWMFAVLALLCAGLGSLAVGRLATTEAAAAEERLATAAPVDLPLAVPARPGAHASAAAAITAAAGPALAAGPPETVADFLAGVPMFAGLDRSAREQLAEAAGSVRLEAGEWLFHEGDEGDALYIVTAGRLEVVAPEQRRSPAGKEHGRRLSVVSRGGVVGEYALLTAEPRSASVRAVRAADLIAIERVHFDEVLLAHPEISRALVRQFATALRANRSADATRRPLPATVAVVALDEGVPLAELVEGLEAATVAYTTVTTLRPGPSDPVERSAAPSVYGPLLDRAAAVNGLVLLPVSSPTSDDAWSSYCLQQADRILAVSSGIPGAVKDALIHLRGCDLVAWDVPAGSDRLREWAEALDPRESHCWRAGPELAGDLSRSARRLTGRSVGIVLGGGGARALAHLGVIEELTAAGVAIDRVGAVSMGSFIGALLAAGRSPEEIDAICYEEWVRRKPLGDYTLPRHALLRGQRGEAMVRRTFGSLAIAELPLSFFCVAADLRSGERVVYRHGSVYDAVSASLALPVLIPPRVLGRDLLVDGAMVDNLPVSTMAELGEGPIVAVDIRAGAPERAGGHDGARPRLPSLAETLMRVMFLGNKLGVEASRADIALLIRPRNDGVGFLEFHQIDRAREAGRRAARQALEELSAGGLL